MVSNPLDMNIKLTKKQIKEIKQLKKKGWKYDDLAKKFKVAKTTIRYHTVGKWSHKHDGLGDHLYLLDRI